MAEGIDPADTGQATRSTRRVVVTFCSNRAKSFVQTVAEADNAEKVRAVIAITLVGVLVALQFAPAKNKTLTASAETLAIAVVAFYFGLHSGVAPRSRRNGAEASVAESAAATGSGSRRPIHRRPIIQDQGEEGQS